MAKEGSTIGGLMDTIGTLVSLALQYGVPLETLVNKFAHQRFEPSGFTKNPDIPIAKSISDYLFRWLGCQFIPGYREANSPSAGQAELPLKEVAEQEKKAVNKPVAELEQTEEAPARPTGEPWRPDRRAATEPDRRAFHAGCARVRHLRRDHRPQRRLLQVPELRQLHGMLLSPRSAAHTQEAPRTTSGLFVCCREA